ncbi:MAG: hypothetical protein KDB00_09825 [Planctomycetales bacterium]|nr:hypothetical protein [Planctomycetales bacterium]
MFRNSIYFVAAFVLTGLTIPASPSTAQDMRVVDIPVMDGGTDITRMKRRGDVRYKIESDFKTVGNFYAKTLTGQGWSKFRTENLQRNFWVQTFLKDKMTLEVRVDTRENGCEVRLTPKGMMWEEDDQPTPKDLPYPKDAADLEYNDFFGSIEYTSPSDVKTIGTFLSDELSKKMWTKVSTDFDTETFVRMKFKQSKSTLDIDVRAEDAGCKVSIRTKGMQWDGMKEEIERAKQQAKLLAEEDAKKKAAAAMEEALAKRNNKPKQGIANLPKLPNEATVVMDGKTFKLSQVIAFEIFDYGEWTTRIVATQKPIKQSTLLDRLRQSDKDKSENAAEQDLSQSWPDPYLQIVLDDQDKPYRLNLLAGGTPGGASGDDELSGTALVEDGRARGTVSLREPGSFFEKVYTAEISFDVPVLTTDTKPTKQIADAPKLPNAGKLVIGGKKYNLSNVVAYEMKLFDEPMTTIVLSEKPLDLAKLTSALGKKAADDYFEFTPQVKLLVDADDNLNSVSIWADNISIAGNSKYENEIVIEDGRARGTAAMAKPDEFFDKEYSFELSFDTNLLGKRAPIRPKPAGSLPADSYDGLPVPEGHSGIQTQGSPFRKEIQTAVNADINSVIRFYRDELASGEWGQWSENASESKIESQSARLVFAGPSGGVVIQIGVAGKGTSITMITRDAQAAKTAGLLPAAGKSRLFIANESAKDAVITVNKSDYKVAAGAGAKSPKTGINWEVQPGNYSFEIKLPNGQVKSQKLRLNPNQTMGVIIDDSGSFNMVELY